MKEKNCKHPALVVAGTLDKIVLSPLGLIDAVLHATPAGVINELSPEYRSTEKSLSNKIDNIDFELKNQKLSDAIGNFIDARTLLIWRLAGPIFLRLAGCTDEQIARICNMLGIYGGGKSPRRFVVESGLVSTWEG